ncbi:MAG: hypothetical protein EXS31_17000 [Pedosphaera sp.]|nr:hypothetical protein [Pedosphaera sp.]
MTFLQPIVLWGLPLVLVPIIIHLINRLRHRPQPWAAMRFLISATRSSISHAKLRQFLILLFRVLAVLTLILFLSRPLAGGWLGWALSPAPDVILILLDRSASMERQIAGTTITGREQALKLFSEAAKKFEETSHLVLIENAFRTPQEISNSGTLAGLSLTAATDTAADIPAMFQAALKWLVENQSGTAEIWIASDLQRSNWLPEDARWKIVAGQLSSLPQRVRVRLLAMDPSQESNTSIALKEITRRRRADKGELHFVADLQRNLPATEPVPLDLTLDDTRSQLELIMDGQALRWRHKADIGGKKSGGWGSFALPADANRRDNTAYFVYGQDTISRATLVTSDPARAKYLRFAAGALANSSQEGMQIVSPSEFETANWDDSTLLVWQETLPGGATAERVRSFVQQGGVALFLPPGRPDAQQFAGFGWGEVQSAIGEKTYRILRWDEDQGPLAKTDEGMSLPVSQIAFHRRQLILGAKNVLAALDDGVPFLTRQTVGRGEVFFCASLPVKEWSSLGDGPVLVPMMQRLMQAGSRRLQPETSIGAGELTTADASARWVSVDSTNLKDARLHAGVYRAGERLLAVNRPTQEDDPEIVDLEVPRRLFGDLPFQAFQDTRNPSDQLQGEFWRIFVFAMLACLLTEAVLILPARRTAARKQGGTAANASSMSAEEATS